MSEEESKTVRMQTIYRALEDGWTVKKNGSRTYEFTKGTEKDTTNEALPQVIQEELQAGRAVVILESSDGSLVRLET